MKILSEVIRGIRTDVPVVALTFDDGPHEEYTEKLLDLLSQHNVKATFFVSGKNIRAHKPLLSKIIVDGHELGNHAYSHCNLVFKSSSFIKKEIDLTDELIKSCGGERTNYFRPPYGWFSLAVLNSVKEMGKRLILWNISTKDYRAKNPEQIIRKVYRQLKPGGIIVMHDAGKDDSKVDRKNTLKAVEELLVRLPGSGYQFCTISELLKY